MGGAVELASCLIMKNFHFARKSMEKVNLSNYEAVSVIWPGSLTTCHRQLASGDDWLLNQALQVSLRKLILAVLGTQGRRREFGFLFEEIASCDEVTRGGSAFQRLPARSARTQTLVTVLLALLPRDRKTN